MKKLLIGLINVYRKRVSPLKRPCCKYYPSCSEYAVTAIERFGAIKGLVLSIWRILRCNPFSGGGIDYVPEKFYIYTLKSRRRREEKPTER